MKHEAKRMITELDHAYSVYCSLLYSRATDDQIRQAASEFNALFRKAPKSVRKNMHLLSYGKEK